MPNRILKESIRSSDTIEQLSPEEEVFFYRLITTCDDYGRIDARPAYLRSVCFPLRVDRVKIQDVEHWLGALAVAGLIQCYSVNGHGYLQMVTWDKHQTVRARRSKFPGPDDSDCIEVASNCKQVQADAGSCSRNPNPIRIQSESESNHVAPDGADSVTEKPRRSKRSKTEAPEGFDEFWEAYPRKKARAVALLAYAKVLKSGVKPETLRAGAENYSKECQLVGREWQFICFPATFLNQQRFDDYQEAPDPADYLPKAGAANGKPASRRAIDSSPMAGDMELYKQAMRDRTRGATNAEDIGASARS